MEHVCFHCFRYILEDGVCPYCGYNHSAQEGKYPLALKPMTTLANRYVLGRVLGQGGFGVTYIALDHLTKSRVAIKEYLPSEFAYRSEGEKPLKTYSVETGSVYEDGKRQFLDEAKTLSEFIGNEHIIRIHSCFEENNTAYFAMEYMEGRTLKQLMEEKGLLPVEEANRILLPVMEALDWVHSKGIVHRDISPDNIMVRADGVSKLIDFGAARYSTGEKSKSLDVILKHGFAPIEQYNRHGRQGPFTDVYAMAATYYYSITGKVPPDSIERYDRDELLRPKSLGVRIKKSTEQVLLKALSVSAADRFQTMADFYNAMMETMPNPFSPEAGEEEETEAEPAVAEEKKENAVQTAQETGENRPEAPVTARKKKTALIIPAVLILCAILAAAVFKTVLPNKKYREAERLLEAGEYEQAIVLLEGLNGYKDSEEKIAEAQQELAYQAADALLEERAYDEAIAAFKVLSGYRDSAEKIEEAQTAKAEAAMEEVYLSAQEKMNAGLYSDAYLLYLSIPGYRDVDTILEQNEHMKRQAAFRENDNTVHFGRYEQDNDLNNGQEEIEWIVLSVVDNKVLLISRYGLDTRSYHSGRDDAMWEDSDMRAWLNGTFMETAFDEAEQKAILLTEVKNGKDQSLSFHNRDSGNDTTDKVFLLSQTEVDTYLYTGMLRMCKATDYAIAHKAYVVDGYCEWWLRSSGDEAYYTSFVTDEGTNNAIAPSRTNVFAVRPAIWIDLNFGNG